MYFICGIPCGIGDPPPYDNNYIIDDKWVELLPSFAASNVKDKNVKGYGIACAALKTYLLRPSNDASHDEIERLFILWVLGQVFFTNSSSNAHVGWLKALENLEKAPDYDWGSSILGHLYYSLDDASGGNKNIFGIWWIIQVTRKLLLF